MRVALVLSAFMVACSSDADDGPPPPTSCAKTQRSGTYLFSATEQSGTCGRIEGGLVSIDPNGPPPDGCTIDRDVWSEGDCKLERTVTCVGTYADSTEWGGRGGFRSTAVGVTRQMTADGARVEGTMTMQIETSSGDTCKSTYASSWSRQ